MAPKSGIDRSKISGPTGPVVQTAYSAKFQLPTIDIPHESLAEGTSIPPPKPSPPPSPPQTPISIDSPNPLRSHPTSSHSLNRQFTADAQSRNGHASPPVSGNPLAKAQRVNTNNSNKMGPPPGTAGSQTSTAAKRTFTSNFHSGSSATASPPSKRQSIRKLLSIKSLASRSSLNLSLSSQQPPQRSESPAPSTITGTTATTISTGTQPSLKKRRSGAFWRKRESFFGLGAVGEGEENSGYAGDTVMGGTTEEEAPRREEEEERRNRTPPPTLPEMETIGEGVRMDYGQGNTEKESVGQKEGQEEEIRQRKRPSGWFGGAGMFEGIR